MADPPRGASAPSLCKVSVIIPVYNTARYLCQCLDSVVCQTLRDIQIICINDGSTDESLEIIKTYAAVDSRILVIDKPNGGYGHSINTGIAAARGEYIGIVESDDFAEPHMYSTLYRAAKTHDAQIAKANFFLHWDKSPRKKEVFAFFGPEDCGGVITPRSYKGGFLLGRMPSVWSAIYERHFLLESGISFLETPGASYQDTSFTFKVFFTAECLVPIHEALIHYRQDNQASSIHSREKAFCICDEHDEIDRFLSERPGGEAFEPIKRKIFLDNILWNYERVSEALRYPFLLRVRAWAQCVVCDGRLNEKYFESEPWKLEQLRRIARDPMEYHIWRHVKRYEHTGGAFPCSEDMVIWGARHDNSPLFSVLIAVYNTEKYLRPCLESIVHQTFRDIEVICIDAGSTDRSMSLVAEYQQRDDRLIAIWSGGEDIAVAWNVGIAASRGTFILFVNAYDWLSSDACETLAEEIGRRSAKPGAIVFGYRAALDELSESDIVLKESISAIKGDAFFETMDRQTLLAQPHITRDMWRLCISREVIFHSNLRLNAQCPFGNDLLFNIRVLLEVRGVSILSAVLYSHRRMCATQSRHESDERWLHEYFLSIMRELQGNTRGMGRSSREMLVFYLRNIPRIADISDERFTRLLHATLYKFLKRKHLTWYRNDLTQHDQDVLGVLRKVHKRVALK